MEDVLDLTSPEKEGPSDSPGPAAGSRYVAHVTGSSQAAARTQGRSQRKRSRPAYLEAYDEGQSFDASQPTASQLVPEPDSPQASLPSHSPEASVVLESPDVSPPPGQQQHRRRRVALHEEDRLRFVRELDTRQEEAGALEADTDVLHSAAGQSEAEAAPARARGRYYCAISAAPAKAGGSTAEAAAKAEVLADSPTVALGQAASPASSSDLQLETFLGAAPAMTSAPAHVAGSSQGWPAKTAPGAAASRHGAPVRETAAASADGSSRAQPAESAIAAAARQAPPVRETMAVEIDSGSDNEPEEPLWEPEPAPRQPAGGRGRVKTAEGRAAIAAAKELEKQQKKEARERARQEKAALKEQEKQQRAQERLDWQREKGRTAQQDILPVLCPSAMNHATTLRIMERLQADEFTYQVNAAGNLPLALHGLCSMVWRRRVYRSAQQAETAAVDSGGARDVRYEDVPYVLVYATGERFVQLLEQQSLDALLSQVAAAHPGVTLSILVEGLHSYLRRRQNAEYRALGPGGGGFNAAAFDDVLARLVLDHPGVRHRCVADAAEAADHVSQLTKALATQPFKVQDSYLHQFGGSGKNSKGVKETLARHPLRSRALDPWFHALSYVVDISPAQAHAIVSQYSSLGQLMAIYADPSSSPAKAQAIVIRHSSPGQLMAINADPSRSQREKENLIADLKSAGTTRRVGPQASQKLHALFTATDPLMQLGELGFNG